MASSQSSQETCRGQGCQPRNQGRPRSRRLSESRRPACAHGHGPVTLHEGDAVRIFSRSADAWVDGKVMQLEEGGFVHVEYDAGDRCRKKLHTDSVNLVVPSAITPASAKQLVEAKATTDPWQRSTKYQPVRNEEQSKTVRDQAAASHGALDGQSPKPLQRATSGGSVLSQAQTPLRTDSCSSQIEQLTLGACQHEVARKFKIYREAHGQASHYFGHWYTYTSVISGILIATAGVMEAVAGSDTALLCVVTLSGANVVLQAFLSMSGFQSLKDRHADASMLFNSLLQDLEFKVVYTCYQSEPDREQAFKKYMDNCAPQIAQLMLQVPPVPSWIMGPISHGYERRNGCTSTLSHGECEAAVNRKLKVARDAHSKAAAHFKRRYVRTSICSAVLLAAVGVLEAVLEEKTRLSWVTSLSALNGVVQSFLNMSAYQSLKDRHSDAALLFNALMREFQFKVKYKNHLTDSDRLHAFEDYMENCAPRVTQLMLQVPPVPQWLITPIAKAHEDDQQESQCGGCSFWWSSLLRSPGLKTLSDVSTSSA